MVDFHKVALLGAGLIGRSWAILCARNNLRVTLYDPDQAALDTARRWHVENVDGSDTDALSRLSYTNDLQAAVAEAEYIQENGPENLAIKHALYRDLDKLISEHAIICSSTSALEPDVLFEAFSFRERAMVAHPTNPPHILPAVELAASRWTSPRTSEKVRRFMLDLGQDPLILKRVVPGFIVNRLQAALVNEALALVQNGVADPDDIDKAVRSALGLRWAFIGPFETMDLNSQGGFEQYAETFGPVFAKLGEVMNSNRSEPWLSEAPRKVVEARREILPLEQLAKRQAWRDQQITSLRRQKASIEDKSKGE
jgi:L-gulonate 3-dehydrogenase